MVQRLDETGADFVYSPAVEVAADGTERINYPVSADDPDKLAAAHFLETNVRNGAVLFQRTVVERVGLLDESLRHNEDSDFLQRAALKCAAAYTAKPTVRVYHHAGNKSADRVAIYRGLLESSKRVLAENPDFRQAMAELADRRLAELNTLLAKALVIDGQYEEARRVLDEIDTKLTPLRIAAAIGARWPLRLENLLAHVVRRVERTPRSAS
jgi:hypothetical protein